MIPPPDNPSAVLVSNPDLLRIRLKPGLKIRLDASHKALLKQLFADCREVLIEQEFEGGYGSTHVFLVTPWKRTKLASLVVKIGPEATIVDEKNRHQEYVKETLPLLAANIERFASQDDLAVMAYTYLGGDILGEGTASLRDYYQQYPPHRILAVLQHLLVEALGKGWYGLPQPGRGVLFFEDVYSSNFPADLTLTLDAISLDPLPLDPAYTHYPAGASTWELREIEPGQTVQLDGLRVENKKPNRLKLVHPDEPCWIRATFGPDQLDLSTFQPGQVVSLRGHTASRRQDDLEYITATVFADSTEAGIDPAASTVTLAGEIYPNPLKLYQNYLNKSLPPNLSIIHGDLHLFNVIVDGYGKPWLIDFGRVRRGHTLFDFIELEVHIRHAILSTFSLPLADLIVFEKCLICTSAASEPPSPLTNPNLRKAFDVIQGIRSFAAKYLDPNYNFQSEYLPALFVYAVSTLDYYEQYDYCATRHSFALAAILAAHLQGQLDCQQATSPILTMTDPALELHLYYLKEAAGDTSARQEDRQQIFKLELESAADALREWLGLSPEQVTWDARLSADRHTMVRRYYSGQWHSPGSQTWAALIAYEMNDTYLLRLIVCQAGSGHSPEVLADLPNQLPWSPDRSLPEWLGQSSFYTALSKAPASNIAQVVFDTTSLRHTTLTCGELYTPFDPQAPYLLIYPSKIYEETVGAFFDQLASQLGWYTHKAFTQESQYEAHLRPTVNQLEQSLSEALAKVRTFHQRLGAGEKDFETLTAFHEAIQALEVALLEFDRQLATVKIILNTIKINVQNYDQVTRTNEFLTEPEEDEIFGTQRRLKRLPRQIEADLGYWQPAATEARHALEILRHVAARFPLADRDPVRLAAAIQEHFQTGSSSSTYAEADLTLMFDDMRDSTRYIDQYGDRQWQKLVQQHDNLIGRIIGRHQGSVIKSLGDGSLTIFFDAVKAVRAALDIQQALQRHNEEAELINQFHLRLGLHTGSALLGDTDVLGLNVSVTARICHRADAGEIVISEVTYHQVGEAAADAVVDFEVLGPQQLKGIDKPIVLYKRIYP